MCFVKSLQPLAVSVPLTQPCGPIRARNIQIRIFKDLQRQAGLPAYLFELQTPARILGEIADRQVTQTQRAIGVTTRKDERLTIRARRYPDHVFVNVTLVYQRKDKFT